MMASEDGRLPLKVRLSYGAGEIGKNSIIFINNFFMLYFYTDVIRIDPGIAAMIIFVARIWDFCNDPLMGIACDKTRSKEGKCRFWLKYFSIPGGFLLFLSYFVPSLQGNAKVVWVLITYLLQCVGSTILNIPMNALAVRLTGNQYERVVLGQYKGIMTIFPRVFINSLTLPMVKLFGGGNDRVGFALCMAVYGCLYAASFLICFWGTRGYERSYEEEKSLDRDEKQSQDLKLSEILFGVIRNKYCLIVMTANILYLVFAAIQSSSIIHYLKYNIGNTDLLAANSMLGAVTGVVSTLIVGLLVKKAGNAYACSLSCGIVAAAEILRLVLQDSTAISISLGWVIEGMGLGIFSVVITQCMYDSVEYGRRVLGVNLQAVVMSLASFGQQVGSAFGAAIAANLLSAVGYSGSEESVTDSLTNLLFAENIVIPMAVFLCIGAIFLGVAKMERQLKKFTV